LKVAGRENAMTMHGASAELLVASTREVVEEQLEVRDEGAERARARPSLTAGRLAFCRRLGFSTGALACGDFRRALAMLGRMRSVCVVELSALREAELEPLAEAVDNDLDLDQFSSCRAGTSPRWTAGSRAP
jgi:hypothetical protein